MISLHRLFVESISLYSYFVKNPVSVSAQSTNKDIASKLTKYREIIDKYYLGDVDDTALEEGAIKGYIEGLGDPYTEYISKEDMESKAFTIDNVKEFTKDREVVKVITVPKKLINIVVK